jgi:hypothetical protein
MAEGHREAAHSVLDGGEHNATLGASGIARLIGSGPLENGHAVLLSGGVNPRLNGAS